MSNKKILIACEESQLAIENPQGIMSTAYKSPDQIIQPWMFGDPYDKRTCLWLKNLPELLTTKLVNPWRRVKIKAKKSIAEWYSNAKHSERAKIRSRTFPGVAEAMTQWGDFL